MFTLLAVSTFSVSLTPGVRYTLDEFVGRAEGRREAERDIAAGAMKLKRYGYLAGLRLGDGTYNRLMRKELGVEVVVVAQCTLTSRERGLWDGYNDRIKEELDQIHGPGALSRVRRDAAQQWRRELVLMVAIPLLAIGVGIWWVARRRGTETGHHLPLNGPS